MGCFHSFCLNATFCVQIIPECSSFDRGKKKKNFKIRFFGESCEMREGNDQRTDPILDSKGLPLLLDDPNLPEDKVNFFFFYAFVWKKKIFE